MPRCGLVTTQIVRHNLCSINFWCGFVCQGVFFLTNAVYTMYHSQNSSFITLLRFEESSISEVLVCEWYIDKVGAVWLTHCCVVILVVGISIDYVFIKNAAYTLKKGYIKLGPQNSSLCITTAVYYRLLEIGICKNYWNRRCSSWDFVI